jgi:mycothiol synthase
MTTTRRPIDGTATHRLEVPGAPDIAGLRFRRPRREMADYDAAAYLMGRCAEADGVPWRPTGAHLRDEWELASDTDMDADIVIAEIDGEMVAVASIDRKIREGVIVYGTEGYVHPAHRRRGIGGTLLAQNVRRAAQRAADDPVGQPVALGAFVELAEAGYVAMLEGAGFEAVRWFHLMRRDLAEPIPEAPLPDGLEIRPMTPDQHRTVLAAEDEAFRDHWGHREPAPEDLDLTFGRAEFDGALWVVAWDGDEVAGVVQNWIWPTENAELGVRRGWLEHISVRRRWRRRGLARAMTVESLRRLRAVDMEDAMLGVDADNPNDAMGLYVGLGFEVYSRAAAYRRPLDRG